MCRLHSRITEVESGLLECIKSAKLKVHWMATCVRNGCSIQLPSLFCTIKLVVGIKV